MFKVLKFLSETAPETSEKLEGWDKIVDWAGGNFNAVILVTGGILAFGALCVGAYRLARKHFTGY